MAEKTVIEDVRDAKTWLDAQSDTLAEHVKRLQQIERAYAERLGKFHSVAQVPSPAVQAMIDAAEDEPGRALLRETRPGKTG